MVRRYMPTYDHGGTPGTPFMTSFGVYVSPQICNIDKFQTYEVYKSQEVSHRVSRELPSRMAPES